MESAISTLTILPTTKSGISDYVAMAKASIISGYIQPEAAAIILKSFEEIGKQLRADKEIKEYIQYACDLHNEKSFEYGDAKFTKSERPSFDFKACEDPEWLRLSMEEMKVKGAKKTREDWLKTLTDPTPDPETGEIINPPTVLKTSIVSIQLKK